MEELLELKECLKQGDYEKAIVLVEELEEMGRQDKINNLESFLTVLLIHLIKIQVEGRVTKSWRNSIFNSLREIQKRNKLGKKSHYIKPNEWGEHIEEVHFDAVYKAAKEVYGGIEYKQLEKLVDQFRLYEVAEKLLESIYTLSERELAEKIEVEFPNKL